MGLVGSENLIIRQCHGTRKEKRKKDVLIRGQWSCVQIQVLQRTRPTGERKGGHTNSHKHELKLSFTFLIFKTGSERSF